MKPGPAIHGPSLLSREDIYLFKEGNHYRMYTRLGSHLLTHGGEAGVCFAVWAPNARSVSVIGDFNGWDPRAHPLAVRRDGSGIWEGFISGLAKGILYKYHIVAREGGRGRDKGDPFAFRWEKPPRTASVVWPLEYRWRDQAWMKDRSRANASDTPTSVYELHLGSWRRAGDHGERFLGYREMADPLVRYMKTMGFTHVEFLPVMEHPFYGSWGYQTTGYFAPTSRYGAPEDLMYLIDRLHRNGIGVILDWVPSHFPSDEFALARFDGTNLFEHADPRQGFHPDWKSCIFNYGRSEVRNFLMSSAMFWLDRFHADGLRVDAVASMLYLDYSRKEGEWIPNRFGGRENLEAIEFIRQLNQVKDQEYPDTRNYAEESTAWPKVTRPTGEGGLGFGSKWSLGWMHDSLDFFSKEPVHRKFHHARLTFSLWYAFNEDFVLPLSHDEVVHGKGSLLGKMPGDEWQKFANLRLLLGWMYTHPGKKLLFMGGEFGQPGEWTHEKSLDWHLLRRAPHRGVQRWVKDLNRLYRSFPALYAKDPFPEGFEWIDFGDTDNGVISFLRHGGEGVSPLLVVCHFTPVLRSDYRIGVPQAGTWVELLNSDARVYGGSGQGNWGKKEARPEPCHARDFSLSLTLPPLGIIVFSGPPAVGDGDGSAK
jgi:1,4-alpha-glucan branching enzyme